MARTKKWTDEEILGHLEGYLARSDEEGIQRSLISIQSFSQYLSSKGIEITDNALRHRPAVAEKFAQAKQGLLCSRKKEADVPPLEETYLELFDLFEEYFEKGCFNNILNHSQDGKFLRLREYLKPEIAEEVIITPKDNPLKTRAGKRSWKFFEKEEKKNE